MDKISCPICFNTLRYPIQVCINGHGLCSSCKDRVPNCPLCTEQFSSSRNLLLNEIIEVLPLTCKFDGCQVILKMTDDHEKWCGYQKTVCRMTNCSWNGRGRDIVEHVKEFHTPHYMKCNRDISINVKNVDLISRKEYFQPIIYLGQCIWFRLANNHEKGVCTVSFLWVPKEKLEVQFVIKLTIGNSRRLYSFITTLTSENYLNEEELSMLWCTSAVQRLMGRDENLSVTINITDHHV